MFSSSFRTLNSIYACWHSQIYTWSPIVHKIQTQTFNFLLTIFTWIFNQYLKFIMSKLDLLTCLQSLFSPDPYSSSLTEILASSFQLFRPRSKVIPDFSFAHAPHSIYQEVLGFSFKIYPVPKTPHHLHCYPCGRLSLRLQRPPNLFNCS